MKYLVFQILFVSTLAFADRGPASCQISDKSILSRTPSGVAQVSNLGLIQIRCLVAARPRPSNPGHSQNGLKVSVSVYSISTDGVKSLMPSEVNLSGGGLSGDSEWVDFYLHILLDPAERDAEIRRFLANLERLLADDQQAQQRIHSLMADPQELAWIVGQSRAGRFQVDCRVLDDDRVIGTGRVALEVLFKGRFSDAALATK